MKKLFTLVLALVLVVAMVPLTASAADTPQLKLNGTVTVPLTKRELGDVPFAAEIENAYGKDTKFYTGLFTFNPQEDGWYTFTSPQVSQYSIYLVADVVNTWYGDTDESGYLEDELENELTHLIYSRSFSITSEGAHTYFGRHASDYEDVYSTSTGTYAVIIAYKGTDVPKDVTLSVKKATFPAISEGQSMTIQLAQIAHLDDVIYSTHAVSGTNENDAYTYVTFTPAKTDYYRFTLEAERKDPSRIDWMFLIDVREIGKNGETTLWSVFKDENFDGFNKGNVTATEYFDEYYLEKGKTYYIGVQNDQPAIGTLTVKGLNPDPAPQFTDVKESDWFYAPVQWAVANGVTSGTGNGKFSPGNQCTRAHAVTFLWNAKGQPEPKSTKNPFTDVKEGTWYYKAVLWAVENNITSGTSATTFSPNSTCTRGQIVTFFHNFAEKPSVSGSNPFKDVEAGKWYYQPILWAVENGVTAGLGNGNFGPNNTCTRGQIVTFLYNYLGK